MRLATDFTAKVAKVVLDALQASRYRVKNPLRFLCETFASLAIKPGAEAIS
jgi:hypothetical protein